MTRRTCDFLADEAAFACFLDQFERGTLPRPVWTHTAHLAVAAWYLLTLPEKNAIQWVRTGIQHYNECAGIRNTPDSGYHETLTMIWLGILRGFLSEMDGTLAKLDKVRRVVAEFGPKRELFRQYYSFDVVASREARARWIAPDKIALRGGNKSTLEGI